MAFRCLYCGQVYADEDGVKDHQDEGCDESEEWQEEWQPDEDGYFFQETDEDE